MTGFLKAKNTITSEEAARNFEAVLDMVDKYHIVLITRNDKPDVAAMGFHYFVEQFGSFLPEDKYAKLKAMDRYGVERETEAADDSTGCDEHTPVDAYGQTEYENQLYMKNIISRWHGYSSDSSTGWQRIRMKPRYGSRRRLRIMAYPVQRKLDGVFFRVNRDGKWCNICLTDLTVDEREQCLAKFDPDQMYRIVSYLADTVRRFFWR